MLPHSQAHDLRKQALSARALWEQDRQAQRGGVEALRMHWRPSTLAWGSAGAGSGYSQLPPVGGLAHGCPATPSPLRGAFAARAEESRDTGGHLQACLGTYLAPQLRHALVAVGLRHSHGAGAAGAFGREHDDDLHPCPESRSRRCLQPVGLVGLALAAWLNDSFGALIWMAAQGPKRKFDAFKTAMPAINEALN
ncbi:hypothetical protein AcdelDRAFT_3714 [Acidovorax delafieldii 2AN]|uniref:Uncharacterized protein n=1 Tax=Acidovorax delafieldii 2AN TaxID=573060 RepID=C5T9Y4_ACIDE|nr:hypothetical protein AcdelDRAFT_3714 [Acidovorax delafieldii 2AN]